MNEFLHLIVGLILYSIFGLSIQLLIAFLIAVLLTILFILDYRFFLLPFNINIALLLIGLIGIGYAEIFKISFLDYNNLLMSLVGAFIGFVFLWLVNFFYKLIKGYEGIGGGDFILLASLGSISGPFSLPFIVLFGSLASILIYFFKIKSLSNQIPLGSGLVLGFLIFILLNYFELLNIYSVI
jgi:leader peptidase (prepilin peptidase)/N-methyltransferase